MKMVGFFFINLFSKFAIAAQLINGAGATFPYPLYSKWFYQYYKQKPDVQINYQSIGSGGGIRQLIDKTVDFGASDAPMSEEEMARAHPPVFHIPTVLGSVVLSYNIEGISNLNLTPELIAEIYMGKITRWNDPKIVAVNSSAKLPDEYIAVAYRSDGSGTTFVFTDYLAKISSEWAQKVGRGKSVKWPAGLGGKGNEGVAGLIKQTPGSIGYVEFIYAKQTQLPIAAVKNKEGNFVMPTLENVTAAAQGALKTMPENFRVSITNADGENAYPISSFTYLLVYKEMKRDIGEPFIEFLYWSMDQGQMIAKGLNYAPLPESLITKIKYKISEITLKP